ncbi:glycoside hydrolase family 92 protein [Acidobacteria bacterium AB60]|nr:glycoside hydrolase family 92 protein [Acidobacteria bacterium AB60]
MRARLCLVMVLAAALVAPVSAQKAPYDAVNPLIGTAGGGNTFPGATLPFGMVQWSPDTNADAWYKYDEASIRGFSLTHVSGAGCPLYGDFAVLPVAGELGASPGKDFGPYAVGYDHSKEIAQPGYYAVTLANGVRVEVTTTERAGIARFTFPEGAPARLLVNAGSSANEFINEKQAADQYENAIALKGADGFAAWSKAGHFCSTGSHYKIYAAGAFDKAFHASALWQDDAVMQGAKSAQGKHSGAWLDFGKERVVQLKVGISFVSEESARANATKELPGWDFEQVHGAAKAVWTELLGRFATEGGTEEQRTLFYTAVYHSFLSPNLFSDEDGRYMGFDNTVHTLVAGQHAQYANFSDWDIYRNTVQLQALFFPEAASDMMQSLVNDAEQGGQLPRWEAANDVTYVMSGDSPVPVIASSYAFGARHFDAETALKWMVKAATETANNRERPFVAEYLKLGYVPSDEDASSASRTLEYASDDFAIAEFAKALGHADIAAKFLKQSENWKNLLDPETKWIRPRNKDGSWVQGFDAERSLPKRGNVPVPTDQLGFEEGNTYQYSFMVPFDYPALFAAMGGEEEASKRLDHFFVKLRCWGEPCYNIENEPDFVVPYAYVFAGQPWKTQEVVTRIGKTTFQAKPDGIPGNDDLGATSGVYLWNALGMYPAVPGVGAVVLGTPLFAKATLGLSGGRTLEISRSGDGIYVKNVTLDGKAYATDWLPVAKLQPGRNRLEFTTQAEPDTTRATKAADLPPSLR